MGWKYSHSYSHWTDLFFFPQFQNCRLGYSNLVALTMILTSTTLPQSIAFKPPHHSLRSSHNAPSWEGRWLLPSSGFLWLMVCVKFNVIFFFYIGDGLFPRYLTGWCLFCRGGSIWTVEKKRKNVSGGRSLSQLGPQKDLLHLAGCWWDFMEVFFRKSQVWFVCKGPLSLILTKESLWSRNYLPLSQLKKLHCHASLACHPGTH